MEYKVVDILSDVASGLNTGRRGLLKLFDYVVNKRVDVVVVIYKNRLTSLVSSILNTSSNSLVLG